MGRVYLGGWVKRQCGSRQCVAPRTESPDLILIVAGFSPWLPRYFAKSPSQRRRILFTVNGERSRPSRTLSSNSSLMSSFR